MDISPASGNKFMPVGLATLEEEAEDPWSAMVAQVSFWWRGMALLVEHGSIGIRVIRCVSW